MSYKIFIIPDTLSSLQTIWILGDISLLSFLQCSKLFVFSFFKSRVTPKPCAIYEEVCSYGEKYIGKTKRNVVKRNGVSCRMPQNGADCSLPLAAEWGLSVIAACRKMGLKGRCRVPQNGTFHFCLVFF